MDQTYLALKSLYQKLEYDDYCLVCKKWEDHVFCFVEKVLEAALNLWRGSAPGFRLYQTNEIVFMA